MWACVHDEYVRFYFFFLVTSWREKLIFILISAPPLPFPNLLPATRLLNPRPISDSACWQAVRIYMLKYSPCFPTPNLIPLTPTPTRNDASDSTKSSSNNSSIISRESHKDPMGPACAHQSMVGLDYQNALFMSQENARGEGRPFSRRDSPR